MLDARITSRDFLWTLETRGAPFDDDAIIHLLRVCVNS
jgi:hypothetical protein